MTEPITLSLAYVRRVTMTKLIALPLMHACGVKSIQGHEPPTFSIVL